MSIRRRGPRPYQVRVAPFAAQTAPTREAAERLELDLKLRRALGDLYEQSARTLGEELDAFLLEASIGRAAGDRTVEFYERSARIWKPFREAPVSSLRRLQVQDFITSRAAAHPRSAKNELEPLKRVLREAKERGQKIDAAVLTIKPIVYRPRRGRGLSVPELYELASWFPEHARRLVLVAGQVGARQNVWFNLTDDLLDLRNQTLTVPAELSKNKRDTRFSLRTWKHRSFGSSCSFVLLARGSSSPSRLASSGVEAVSASACGCAQFEKRPRRTGGSTVSRSTCSVTRRILPWPRSGWTRRPRRQPTGTRTEGRSSCARTGTSTRVSGGARHSPSVPVCRPCWTRSGQTSDGKGPDGLNDADSESGRTWDRTRDLPRVKRALSR